MHSSFVQAALVASVLFSSVLAAPPPSPGHSHLHLFKHLPRNCSDDHVEPPAGPSSGTSIPVILNSTASAAVNSTVFIATSALSNVTVLAEAPSSTLLSTTTSSTKSSRNKVSSTKSSTTETSATKTSTMPTSFATSALMSSTSSKASSSSAKVKTATSATAAADPSACHVSEFTAVGSAVASCTDISLDSIAVPASGLLDLTKLKQGTKVTFTGTTTFAYAATTSDLVQIAGVGITVTMAEGAVINGNGPAWWDGQGSNGGGDKPDHFITLSKVTGGSTISNLNIVDYPTHCFQITNCADLTLSNIVLNNSAGDAPNSKSDGDPAAHNTDGFDISSSTNVVLESSTVYNQDDCVAITSGDTITVQDMYCSGSHGLSIGSVGGKSDNDVSNILFKDSVVVNSQNGARIKTNSGTTGNISNVTYENISLSGITTYGIDIQQDYLNGGPTGDPTNGVSIGGITMTNITGTMSKGKDYYILCGSGSCSDFVFNDINIKGGSGDSCNFTPSGDFTC